MAKRRGSIVPRVVLGASFVAVVPQITACSGPDPIVQFGQIFYGVAAVAYCCFDAGVADVAFVPDATDSGDAPADAPDDVDTDATDAPTD
jgi:hypothetical protein